MPSIGQSAGSGAATGATLGSIVPGIGTGIGALVGGAIGLVSGISQKSKAKKLLSGLQYPTEQLPQEVVANQRLAQQRAAEGLPSEQYNQAMRNIQRQQLMALRGAHDRRGGLGILPGIQQGTNDATLNLDVANANARLGNERQLMNVNNQVANWKSQLFNANVRDKYNRDYNYAMGLKGMGNQNIVGGLDSLAAGGIGLLTSGGRGTGRLRNPQTRKVTNTDYVPGYGTDFDQFPG